MMVKPPGLYLRSSGIYGKIRVYIASGDPDEGGGTEDGEEEKERKRWRGYDGKRDGGEGGRWGWAAS
ncbi:MAG TPA: hypothetical protein PK377_09020 [Methanothrix sp.]|nr:hypothetical protein [Methanothrix sp.]